MRVNEVASWMSLLGLLVKKYWWIFLLWLACLVSNSAASVLLAMLGAAIISTGLHEAGHVIGYRLSQGRLGVFRLTFVGPFALSARPNIYVESRFVVASGPLLPALLGIILWGMGMVLNSAVVVGSGVVFLVHALGLLPGSSDGNRIWGLADAQTVEMGAPGSQA